MSNRVKVFVVAVVATLGFASTAHAITYGADIVGKSADGSYQVHVEGFQAGDAVTVTLSCTGQADVTLGTPTAEADGTIDEFYTLPAGTNVDTCSIDVAGGSISRSYALGTGGGGLPATGSDTTSVLPLIAGLVGVGAVLVGVAAFRRRAHA